MTEKPLIEIKNLSISFGTGENKVRAVKNLNYSVPKGKTVGIVGESGSGKSLTSLSIMGLLHPAAKIESGEIYFDHFGSTISLLDLSDEEMRQYRGNEIAMIFQEPMTSLNPVIKCGEQVAEALRLHKKLSKKEAKLKTIEWFNEVQLPRPEQIYESYPHQISGGQKQRVMIAMAMCCEPQLLIADEPTTALDVTVQKTILELIKALQIKHNMSVIFITHDLGVVAEIADEVVVMKSGEKVESNKTSSLFENPQHPYTKGLLACRPPMDFRLKSLPTVEDFLSLNEDQAIDRFLSQLKVSEKEQKDDLNKVLERPKLIEIKNLKTYFPIQKGLFRKTVGYVKAVDDVSFHVHEGETLGLVGESGCGKTTLGRSILRLIEPTSGSVKYKGTDINSIGNNEMRSLRKDLQIIFQDPYSSLNPRMKIGNAILEPMQVHKIESNNTIRKEKVIDLMETVGLNADQFNRYPHEFSGGQRQRVCIARTLALSPKFIICDESVSALDVSVQAQVLNLLNELKNKFSFTYIFISHDLSVAKYMSDRMIVMKDGQIEELGVAEDIYRNPQSDYTKTLIEAIPRVDFANF
ncbi:MAG: ABC transporter ATP-binding protein [Flavobacteriales bacterium]|nr:ABC transporter ATP-binding protein [Flavobacteriales bacterium]